MTKKRWISLYVENDIGVLAKISGLFSSKLYNMESLTVGRTADESISRITIGVLSDDATFEQIKKQLNRCVEVIKVLDFTDIPIHSKELMYVKLSGCSEEEKDHVIHIAEKFCAAVVDEGGDSILLECVMTESENNDLVLQLSASFEQLEIVRGGSVAIQSIAPREMG